MGMLKQEAIREAETGARRNGLWQPPLSPQERRAIRLVAVQAATAFLAPRPEAKREHVTQLAEILEGWITR